MKRIDIQCIRAIAILAVLFFHLFPTIFENGFLGVDVFFVLSGYLMSTSKPINILDFYYRRVRRILPLYYLILFLTTLAVQIFLIEVWWYNNHRYYLSSLFLITNQLIIHDSADYFLEFQADGSSLNAFIHCWSLGVEMQFYLIVPFIFIGFSILKTDFLKFIASITMTFISMILFHFINPQFAFNFMPLRLWQFSMGFIAFFYIRTEISAKILKYPIDSGNFRNIILTCLFLMFLPIKMNIPILRILLTFSTGILLTFDNSNDNIILNNRILCHIGDLSYIIYLIHWPLIIIIGSSTIKYSISTIMLIIIISSFLHYGFEKTYMTKIKSKLILIGFLGLLILSNAYLYKSVKSHKFWKNEYPEELQEIITTNLDNIVRKWKPLQECDISDFEDSYKIKNYPVGYCKYFGNGTKNIMVIGNSYTANFVNTIKDAIDEAGNYSVFQYASFPSCYGIYSDDAISNLSLSIAHKLIAKEKLDILMIMSRYSESIKKPFYSSENDKWIEEFNKNIEIYEKFTKHIFILGAFPFYAPNSMNAFIQNLIHKPEYWENMNLKKYDGDIEMKYIRKRLRNIKCKSCQIIDLSPMISSEEKYLLFNRTTMLSYIDNSIHLTKPGLELFQPYFANFANDIFNKYD
ncbi:unnamed protein product [Caenorhabditis angaria]|uniref:SGNH domain-containing protein n=1 Tax=Caenorhabditis angaria TaxID=860376 RepID=A0A9P1IMD2_9PELO|nr:unnamed protein product [Caenorhabditis angaria]